MPHPDEGVIHAWLDGELDATETARVEALMASDPAWGAAVAEARGLKAASSRILDALDHVPAGVSPKRESPVGSRSRHWWTMRVAALLVVVAGASLVLRESGSERALQVTTQPSGLPTVASAPPDAAGPARGGEEPRTLVTRSTAPSVRPSESTVRSDRASAASGHVAANERPSRVADAPATAGAPATSVVAAWPRSAAQAPTAGVLADASRPGADSVSGRPQAPALLALEQGAAADAMATRREERVANRAAAGALEGAAKSSAKMAGSTSPARCYEGREPLAIAGRIVRHPPDSVSLAVWRLLAFRSEDLIERGDSLQSGPGANSRVVAVRVACPAQP